jgi:hypothetical protein
VPNAPQEEIDALLEDVLGSTPLLFIKQFLREQRNHSRQIRIGATREEVRQNLRDAIISKRISGVEVARWQQEVEGWGKQHLYLSRLSERLPIKTHLLNTAGLKNFLKRKGLWGNVAVGEEPASHILAEVDVNDETARITWRSHDISLEHRDELDYVEDRDDGEYEFRAYRRTLRRSASRLIIRKTDGIVAQLVDLPLGDGHTSVRNQMSDASRSILAPLLPATIALAAIVSALDEGAVARSGRMPKRSLNLGVAPTQARYRTDGAQVEFKSTRESAGYTDCEPVRHIRRALRIESFQGEAGKFRLTFDAIDRKSHDMIVSLHALDNRIYLFSRMTEIEVLRLVDQLISL